MSKLKIAIAGLGFGEKVHIPAIKESDHFDLKFLYHHDKNKIDQIEKKTGIKSVSYTHLTLPTIE